MPVIVVNYQIQFKTKKQNVWSVWWTGKELDFAKQMKDGFKHQGYRTRIVQIESTLTVIEES